MGSLDLSKFPPSIEIEVGEGTREGCFTIIHDWPGWLATYMFYDSDILELDYCPTLEEALQNLSERIELEIDETKSEIITEEYLKSHGYNFREYLETPEWVSEDGRVTISKFSNTVGRDWCVHVDNEAFETIGSLDVQDIDMLESFLKMTGR